MASRLSTILENEYKRKGLVGGLASASGKRILEVIDPRNLFFGGNTLGGAIGRKIFGKGYSATRGGDKSGSMSSVSQLSQNLNSEVLEQINKNSAIAAKNSVVLPSMARDMNLTRMNIIKLVKLQGGTPSTKADMFFSRAKERESMYESQFGKRTANSPQQLKKEGEGKSSIIDVFKTIFSGIATIVAGAWKAVTFIADKITSLISNIVDFIQQMRLIAAVRGLGDGMIPTPDSPDKGGKTDKPSGNKSPAGSGKFALGKFLRFGTAAGAMLYSSPLGDDEYSKDYLRRQREAEKSNSPTRMNGSGLNLSNLNESQQKMADLIYTRFTEAGFTDAQAKAALANALAESSLRPEASNITAKEESYGLFQMNRKGGLGSGYSPEQLKDPEFNIQLAIAAAKKSKDFSQATNIQEATRAFVTDVERPADKAGAIAKRTTLAMEIDSKNAGSRINQVSFDNQLAKSSGAGETMVSNINNVTNNNGGGGSMQLAAADVMDTELGRLLLTRMY